jgi:hypothetical protein
MLAGRALVRASVREFLLNEELGYYREIVEAQGWAKFAESNEDEAGAENWRQVERTARERLERFKPVARRCEEEKVSWERMVHLLHEQALYEKGARSS